VLAAVAVALWLLFRDGDDSATASSTTAGETTISSSEESSSSSSSSSSSTSTSTSESDPTTPAGIPPATVPPDGLGDDPFLDELAQTCYDGIMEDCDSLYGLSEDDSLYQAYGDTCAGRQPEGTQVLCAVAFPED
jgi:hypothetical protein